MTVIPLQNIPNQEVNLALGGIPWRIRVYDCISCMAVDIYQDGVAVLLGYRLLANALVIPYKNKINHGILTFLTVDDELPHWSKFGISQVMTYIPKEEIF